MARNVEFNEEQVIQKATEVFWRKGYSATSMRDLTDAMQINISSLYNTIGDKRQLFIRCIKYYTDVRIQEAEKQSAHFDSPLAALEAFIKHAAHIITTEPDSCMCVKIAFETGGTDPDVLKVINAYNNYNHQFLKALLTEAQQQGDIPASEDPATLANYLDSVFTGWYNSYIMYKDRERIMQMAGYVIRQLRH